MRKAIFTLGHPSKRTQFEYSGDVISGVTLNFKSGDIPVSDQLFQSILDEFRERSVPGGFSMTNPIRGGLGEWVEFNSSRLNSVRLSPRHASFIAAILENEGYIKSSLEGNAVYLHFD